MKFVMPSIRMGAAMVAMYIAFLTKKREQGQYVVYLTKAVIPEIVYTTPIPNWSVTEHDKCVKFEYIEEVD